LICSLELVDGAVTLAGAFVDIMLDEAFTDVTLVGALVTLSPASSSRDGERGGFNVAVALAVICCVFAGATLALADVTLVGALVTLSPASSSRDGGAGGFNVAVALAVTLVGAVMLDGALADVTLVGAVMLDGALADVTLVGAVMLDGALADVTLVGAVMLDGAVTLTGVSVTFVI
jgi:hypothetical protein